MSYPDTLKNFLINLSLMKKTKRNGKMLNEEIVKTGYATVMTIPPNVKYQDRFLKAYREARENKKGLWKE